MPELGDIFRCTMIGAVIVIAIVAFPIWFPIWLFLKMTDL